MQGLLVENGSGLPGIDLNLMIEYLVLHLLAALMTRVPFWKLSIQLARLVYIRGTVTNFTVALSNAWPEHVCPNESTTSNRIDMYGEDDGAMNAAGCCCIRNVAGELAKLFPYPVAVLLA